MSFLGCCCFYPKYKTKVDKIYPRDANLDLIKSEIDKLNYYVRQHPEKLSKIAEYLYQNLKWGLAGRYKNQKYVSNTMEAVDGILIILRPDTINAFTSNYLKIIQRLLEQQDYEQKILATNSFKLFCKKERNQNISSYNRQYGHFIELFSSMLYRDRTVQIPSLQCLGAIIKYLAPNESVLAPYLWDNMDKILNSLLHLLQERLNNNNELIGILRKNVKKGDILASYGSFRESNDEENTKNTLNANEIELEIVSSDKVGIEAQNLLKEISLKTDFTTITRVVKPTIDYFELNQQWENINFVSCVFETLMYNVRQQQSIIIKELLRHLDSHRNSNAKFKMYLLKVFSLCIQISVTHSIGTTAQIIEIISNLLKNLNLSIEKSSINRDDEIEFQNEILHTMKEYTSNLPDYAINDVIMFITRQINTRTFNYNDLQPQLNNRLNTTNDDLLKNKYLDALYEICTKYKSAYVFGAFSSEKFVEDILCLTLIYDSKLRLKAHEIIQFLLNKNKLNLHNTHINKMPLIDLFDMKLQPNKEDLHFMRKYGRLFLGHLNEGLFLANNTKANYESLFKIMSLFLNGVIDKQFLIDFLLFGLYVQELTLLNYDQLKFQFKYLINGFLTGYFALIAKMNLNSQVNDYINKIIDYRKTSEHAKYLYPEYIFGQIEFDSKLSTSDQFENEFNQLSKKYIESNYQIDLPMWLFNRKKIKEILGTSMYYKSSSELQNKFNNSDLWLKTINLNDSILKQSLLKYRSCSNLLKSSNPSLVDNSNQPTFGNRDSIDATPSSINTSSNSLSIISTNNREDTQSTSDEITFKTIKSILLKPNSVSLSTQNLVSNPSDEDLNETIISKFKQQTFDQIENNLRLNRELNNDNFNRVMNMLSSKNSKENLYIKHSHNQQHNQNNDNNTQKYPLNDIDFPNLFIY